MSFSKLDRYKNKVAAAAPRKVGANEVPTSDAPAPGASSAEDANNTATATNATTNNGSNTATNPTATPALPVQSRRYTAKTVSHIPTLRGGVASLNGNGEKEESNPFLEPDSENNLLFLNQAEVKNLNTTVAESRNSLPPPENDGSGVDVPQIKGAALAKLVERITFDKYADPSTQSDFLLTFRSFTTPNELLSLLIKRWNQPPPKGLSYGELQDWKQNKQKPIRLRIINLIKNWLEKNWKDFVDDPELGKQLYEFLMEDMMQSGNVTPAQQLSGLYTKKRDAPEQERSVMFSEAAPKPFLPDLKAAKKKDSATSSSLGLMDFHSEEIARQLTLIEYNLYKAIKAWEFFNQAWTKKNKEDLSPNIIKMIKRFNLVSNWVATEIVQQETLKGRTQVLNKFIEVAEKCRQYNNFNALMEIISGLQSSSVYRLHQTWDSIPSKQRELFEELKELMSRQGNFAKLRKHLRNCNPPLIPYLGVFLTDLTFIEDGNPDLLEGGLINWVKRRRLATVLKDIQQYQQKPYHLEEVPFIQEYLLKCEPLDEDQCYKLSLQRETRSEGTRREGIQKRSSMSSSLLSKLKKDNSQSSQKSAQKAAQNQPQQKGQQATPQEEEEEDEDEEFELEYRPGYKFYDKDSEHNIQVERDTVQEMDIIVAGTLPKLVERLTTEKYHDTKYMMCFLMTYRTFTTPGELLDLLQMRFHIPPPINPSPALLERFTKKKSTPISLRVLNVTKTWVDKYFEDFRGDQAILKKLLEFVDKSWCNNASLPHMQRAGDNLKAQIANKLEEKSDVVTKKEWMFDVQPPESILPVVPQGVDAATYQFSLLEYAALEIARQMTLINFDLFSSVKPLEYLHLNKSSTWSMTHEEQAEEDPNNVKNSPNIVAVFYRFTDVRDWVATEIMKSEDKTYRAQVIEHFIQVAHNCMQLKNFQGVAEIVAGLTFDFITDLKSTWQLVPLSSVTVFFHLRELISFRNNYKVLRAKLASVDYPCIPYIGMYISDMAGVKEQMPDTIEPFSHVNFAKRQKLSQMILEVFDYQQQPFCLQPVPAIQDYLRTLDIYELGEMRVLSNQYQEVDGDKAIEGSIFDILLPQASPQSPDGQAATSPRNSLQPQQASPGQSPAQTPRGSLNENGLAAQPGQQPQPAQNGSAVAAQHSMVDQRHSPSSSPRSSMIVIGGNPLQRQNSNASIAPISRTPSSTNMARLHQANNAASPGTSPHTNAQQQQQPATANNPTSPTVPARGFIPGSGPSGAPQNAPPPRPVTPGGSQPRPVPAVNSPAARPAPQNPPSQQAPVDVKASALELLKTDAAFRNEVHTLLQPFFPAPAPAPAPAATSLAPASSSVAVDSPGVDKVLQSQFPGCSVAAWSAADNLGSVYGWPEEIAVKLVQTATELYVVPLSPDGNYSAVDKADLSVQLRVAQMYETMNRFTLNQRPKIAILGTSMDAQATKIATQFHIKFISLA